MIIIRELVDIFKSIAEETRLRLLNLLLRHCDTGICACELIDALEKLHFLRFSGHTERLGYNITL
jgi:DNA-binding transcriptional ArsR family regulator